MKAFTHAEGQWHVLYKCDRCGRVIEQDTLDVVRGPHDAT